jgi:RimJ/RimL family protein N-acetyltransferase
MTEGAVQDLAKHRARDSPAVTPTFFLCSRRLGFRRWCATDTAHAQSLWGDAEVTRFFGGPFPTPEIEARLAREIAQQANHGVQYWPIFLLENQEFVGCCGLRPYPSTDFAETVYELGFHLRTQFWGRGLAMEAARAVIDHAFDALSATSLFAGHHPDNAASARLLEKLGFRYDRHEFYAPTGREHPSYLLLADAVNRSNRDS